MKISLQNILMALLICAIPASAANALEKLPEYELSVSIDPKLERVRGIAKIISYSAQETVISMGNLKALSVLFNGVPFEPESSDGQFKIPSHGTAEITYEGVFTRRSSENNLKSHNALPGNIISNEGISLTSGWYPEINNLAHYILKATVPHGFTAISEAEDVLELETKAGKEYSFLFPHPLDGIHLAANRYMVIKDDLGEIGIFGYFLEEDIKLAEVYVNYAKRYIKMYEDLIAPFPFKRFSVVENNLPTGYSMPTFTLLGKDVVRLPFIVDTSLGHEVLHQWFGNMVFTEYEEGNWVEGLTTYLADHLYEEKKQRGWLYRKNALTNYQSYVTPKREAPLKDFLQRTDFASKAVGYGKGAMLFHMLKGVVGEGVFVDALRMLISEKQFERASWADIRSVFEKASGETLEWFFRQWLDRKDIPCIEIKVPRMIYIKGVPTVSFELVQQNETNAGPYKFDIKVVIATEVGDVTRTLHISDSVNTFEIPVAGVPFEMTLDPDYDLMRELVFNEYPPVLSRLIGDEGRIVVSDHADGKIYSALIDLFNSKELLFQSENVVKDSDISASSLLLLGKNNSVYKRLFGVKRSNDPAKSLGNQETHGIKQGFTLSVKKHPLNPLKVVAIACGTSEDEVSSAARKLFHYGRYSKLGFEKGRNIEKSTVTSARGIRVNLRHSVRGITPSEAVDLDEIIDNIIDKPIIYVGETHTSYEDHRVQLEVVRRLHISGRKVAVGMEMFQRQFQKGLDDYLSGQIDEREFLKATKYFSRWKFDYHLYKEIIDFAKANSIPVLALNIDSDITEKIARGGLDALSEAEKKQIPPDMDMSNEKYIQRLKAVFEQDGHKIFSEGSFYNFYQAQILWDETMAHAIDEFLSNNNDYQMVVLAGAGHIMYGSGIPERVNRLNGKDYSILISSNLGVMEDIVADYVLFPDPLNPPSSPKLGIFIKNVQNGVQIDDFTPESIALESGLEKEDIIVFIDSLKIETIGDLKIALFDRRAGESLEIKVLRKKFFMGRKEMIFSITLP